MGISTRQKSGPHISRLTMYVIPAQSLSSKGATIILGNNIPAKKVFIKDINPDLTLKLYDLFSKILDFKKVITPINNEIIIEGKIVPIK